MSWSAITADDVLQEWNTKEPALIANQQAAADNLPVILARAVARVRGAIRAGGYPLGLEGTVPDQVIDSVIAIARWRLLLSLPEVNESMLSKSRKDDYEEAVARLERISQQKENIEPPDGSPVAAAAGNWNSENKIVPRGHPVPPPATQSQQPAPPLRPYANPDAPEDT